MKLTSLALCAALALAACSTAPASNELNVDRNGQSFTGTAGAAWTDTEIRAGKIVALCRKNERVVDFALARDAEGTARFSGRCVA